MRLRLWIGTGAVVLLTMPVWAQPPARDYKKSADQVTIVVQPDVRQKGDTDKDWKQVIAWLESKDNWQTMFKHQDVQLGIYRKDGLPITATLQSKDTSPVLARASPGNKFGTMDISVSAIVSFSRRMKMELLRVTEMFITHELTHCLQQGAAGERISVKWPLWMIEGMACYAAEDPYLDQYFKVIKQQGIRDLDVISGHEAYARGRLFFKYLLKTYGEEKLKSYVAMLYQQANYKEALEKTVKKKWETFKAEELKWSTEYAKPFM